MPEFEPVIGLEVHAQLRTAAKVFCGCEVRFGAPPNDLTCPVCLGLPGALPVLNRQVVTLALRLALAAGCTIRRRSVFARKNYFYPDLPKGYQISQFDLPLAENGRLEIEIDGTHREFRIRRVHLEEDAGKLIHEGPLAVEEMTVVDFNRSGVPLVEIVGEPDIRSPEEAYAYLMRLKSLLTYTEVCDGNMEEGSLRCDANVSIRPRGVEALGTRIELKNLNSFRNVERALRFEIARQEELVRAGGSVAQETRLYDAAAGVTRAMRAKEEAHDYRYFPDPDLLPLTISEAWIEEVRSSLPELPGARKARFVSEYGLIEPDAELLTLDRPLSDYFEAAVFGGESRPPRPAEAAPGGPSPPQVPPREVAKRILREVMTKMKEEGLASDGLAARYPPRYLTELVMLQQSGAISGPTAAEVFEFSWRSSAGGQGASVEEEAPPSGATRQPASITASPEAIVAGFGLGQVSDEPAILEAVEDAIRANPRQLEQYRAGKDAIFGYFVGQVMKKMGGRGNPSVVNRLVRERLGKERAS